MYLHWWSNELKAVVSFSYLCIVIVDGNKKTVIKFEVDSSDNRMKKVCNVKQTWTQKVA